MSGNCPLQIWNSSHTTQGRKGINSWLLRHGQVLNHRLNFPERTRKGPYWDLRNQGISDYLLLRWRGETGANEIGNIPLRQSGRKYTWYLNDISDNKTVIEMDPPYHRRGLKYFKCQATQLIHLENKGCGCFLSLWSSPSDDQNKHTMIKLRNDISKKERWLTGPISAWWTVISHRFGG